MAKTIKFNLICDGKPVRTLEDLKNNFSIEDVLGFYHNQLLQRWLLVRGYESELIKVEGIQETDTLEIVKALVSIFEINIDPISIELNTYILKYKQEKEILLDEYKNAEYKVNLILDDYFAGYNQLVLWIVDNKDNIAVVKAAINEINNKYSEIYEVDYRNIFYTFLKHAPLAIFVMLTHERMRRKYLYSALYDDFDQNIGGNIVTMSDDAATMYYEIVELCNNEKLLASELGNNLRVYSGVTEGYWKDVETNDKKYIILSMQDGNFVRSTGVAGGDLRKSDTNGKFVILDGIDYKSNNAYHKLLYMEV